MLTDFHIALEALRPIQWPHFAGGRIRGAWGRALRQAACITGQPTCEGCAVRSRCSYGVVFDPAASALPLHPSFRNGMPAYVVQPPPLGARQLRPGESAGFTLRLLTSAPSHNSLIEHVLRDAVHHHLFNPGDCSVLSCEQISVSVPAFNPAIGDPPVGGFHIEWLTPLRLQLKGKPLFRPQDLDACTLIAAGWRRYLQLCQLSGQTPVATTPPLAEARRCHLTTHQTQWHDISRYSNTQQRHLPLGGLLGHATLTGPDDALGSLAPVLRLGELLHIGKETVFGLGRYQLRTQTSNRG